jgi:hypothetical protein
MSGVAQLVKMGAKGVDALVDALRAGKKAAPQDEALALAQQRAALPVSQGGLGLPPTNTAMDRAKAMGFDADVYHGTGQNVTSMKGRPDFYGDEAGAIYTTPQPQMANEYANLVPSPNLASGQNLAANVMPLKMRTGKAVVYDASQNGDTIIKSSSGKVLESIPKDKYGRDWTLAQSRTFPIRQQENADSAIFKQIYDRPSYNSQIPDDVYVTFNPDNIRSRFAAFDPWRRTAAVAATMGVAAPNLLAEELRKK